MNSTLNLLTKILAFNDQTVNNNPKLRAVDWEREISGTLVQDADTKNHSITIGQSKLVFDGLRATTLDGSSAFSLALLSTNPSSYRITHTGGTNPTLRTGRSLTLTGLAVTFLVNSNNTVNVSVPSLSPSDFTTVIAGDSLFVPHTSTGDAANVLNILNAGYWVVLSKNDATNIVVTRGPNETFEGVSETVTLTSNAQLRAFSAAGVQVGDSVSITSGFSAAAQKSFIVTAVTDNFFEFVSSSPLPNQTSITPTASGMAFYTDNKRLLYIEADQECVVRINGDTGNFQKLSPVEAGNSYKPGIFLKWGSVFSLTVVNTSSSTLNILVITAE